MLRKGCLKVECLFLCSKLPVQWPYNTSVFIRSVLQLGSQKLNWRNCVLVCKTDCTSQFYKRKRSDIPRFHRLYPYPSIAFFLQSFAELFCLTRVGSYALSLSSPRRFVLWILLMSANTCSCCFLSIYSSSLGPSYPVQVLVFLHEIRHADWKNDSKIYLSQFYLSQSYLLFWIRDLIFNVSPFGVFWWEFQLVSVLLMNLCELGMITRVFCFYCHTWWASMVATKKLSDTRWRHLVTAKISSDTCIIFCF